MKLRMEGETSLQEEELSCYIGTPVNFKGRGGWDGRGGEK